MSIHPLSLWACVEAATKVVCLHRNDFTLRSFHPVGWLVICQPDTKPGGDRVSVGNNEREKESTEGVSWGWLVLTGVPSARLSSLSLPLSIVTLGKLWTNPNFFPMYVTPSIWIVLSAFRISRLCGLSVFFLLFWGTSPVPLLQFHVYALPGSLQSSAEPINFFTALLGLEWPLNRKVSIGFEAKAFHHHNAPLLWMMEWRCSYNCISAVDLWVSFSWRLIGSCAHGQDAHGTGAWTHPSPILLNVIVISMFINELVPTFTGLKRSLLYTHTPV